MARPSKEGLDYFPLDVDIDQDDKLMVPIGKYGMQGFGIIIKLMAEVYKNGYFYPWGEKEQYVFARRINVDIRLINEVINECINWGFFQQKLFDEYRILTSKGFQKRYIEAAKRRKEVTLIEQYVLVDVEEIRKLNIPVVIVYADGNRVNDDINPDKSNSTSTETPQSKVKEKESKKETKELITLPPPGKLSFADMVFLTQEEADKIISDNGQTEFEFWVSQLSDYHVEQKSKNRLSNIKTDHYRTILNWIRKDQRNRGGQSRKRTPLKAVAGGIRELGEQLKREQEGKAR